MYVKHLPHIMLIRFLPNKPVDLGAKSSAWHISYMTTKNTTAHNLTQIPAFIPYLHTHSHIRTYPHTYHLPTLVCTWSFYARKLFGTLGFTHHHTFNTQCCYTICVPEYAVAWLTLLDYPLSDPYTHQLHSLPASERCTNSACALAQRVLSSDKMRRQI